MSLEYLEEIPKQSNIQVITKKNPSSHGVLFSIYEIDPDPEKNKTRNKIFERIIVMPKNAKSVNISINQLLSKFCLTLLAKGIEKKMQYKGEIRIKNLSIGKLDDGLPDLSTSLVSIIIYHD